jgi:hypothetical protein
MMIAATMSTRTTAPTTMPAIAPALRPEPPEDPSRGSPEFPEFESPGAMVTMVEVAPWFHSHADTLNTLRS